MNTALWIMQGALALLFIMPGFMKLTSPKQKLIDGGQLKADGNILPIRLLGLVELLGVVGIIVPYLTGIAPVLTPLAAVGFGIVMIGAIVLHTQKHDYKVLPLLIVALVLSGVVAYYRF